MYAGNKQNYAKNQLATLSKNDGLFALLSLYDCWGENAFDIVDHLEADAYGVGTANRNDHSTLAYIQNYRRPDGRYFVELETHPNDGSTQLFDSAGIYDNIGLEELKLLVRRHLRI